MKNLIMAALSAAGTIATAILSIRAYRKMEEYGSDMDTKETIDTFAPPIIAGATTIGLIFANQISNSRQLKATTVACSSLATSYGLYRNEIREKCGEALDEDVYEKISCELLGDWKSRADTKEEVLCFYEPKSDRYFYRTMRFVMEAAYIFNRNYALGGYMTLNDYYTYLDLPHVEDGDLTIWEWEDGYSWVDFCYIPRVRSDGVKYFEITTPFDPHMYYEGDLI